MNKRLLLMVLLALAALLLAACGEPALQAEVSPEGEAAHTEAEASTEGESAAAEATPAEEATLEATPVEATPAEEATAAATAVEASATTEPPTEAAPATEQAPPAEAAQAEVTPIPGDPAHGEELFTTMRAEVGFACATCHRTDSEEQLIGPGLLNTSVRAATREDGLDAYAYIYQSITDPGAYVVTGFPDNLMPRTYSELFSEQDIQDIIAYLFTLTN